MNVQFQTHQILVENASLSAVKFKKSNKEVTKLIDVTKQKQVRILKMKQVDQERLRTTVQL